MITDSDSVTAGGPGGGHVRIALRLRLADGWHTYWHNPGDAGVAPDPELAQHARTIIGVEDAQEVFLAARGAGLDDPPALEPEPGTRDLMPEVHGRVLEEGDDPLGHILDR